MKKLSLILLFAIFTLISFGCSEGQTASPTLLSIQPTATPLPADQPATPETDMDEPVTPTASEESEPAAEPLEAHS